MTTQLGGILSALATPFTPQGDIDEARLRRLVDRNIAGGVAGVVAGGSTGEFAAMTGAERRLLVETVVDQTARRVPVVAQTGAMSSVNRRNGTAAMAVYSHHRRGLFRSSRYGTHKNSAPMIVPITRLLSASPTHLDCVWFERP